MCIMDDFQHIISTKRRCPYPAKNIQKIYSNLNIYFKSQSMHYSKFPCSICKNIQKMTCLGDHTHSILNLLVMETWVSSLYIVQKTLRKSVGNWQCNVKICMFDMIGICLWSNTRLFMHGCKHHFSTSFFWYLKNYLSESGQAFCSEEICSTDTLWVLFH